MAFHAAVIHVIHPVRTMVRTSTHHAAISLVVVIVPWNTARGKSAADAAANMMLADGGVWRRKAVHWQVILDGMLWLPLMLLLLLLQLLWLLSMTGNSARNDVFWVLRDQLDEPALPAALDAPVAVPEHMREPTPHL